jgi:regulatory protein
LFDLDPDIEKAKKTAFQLLERRAYTRSEIVTKLRGRGYDEPVVTATVETLERLDLIDDVDFASRFIRERLRLRPSGHAALRRDLRRRGVEASVIEAALDEAFEDIDIEAVAFGLLCGRRSRYLHLDRVKALNRMYGFLGRRGFPFDVARSAAARAFEEMGRDGTTDPG